MRPRSLGVLFVLLSPFVFHLSSAPPAAGQGCFYADFDDDGDPWTLRAEVGYEIPETPIKLILEVPQNLPLDRYFWVEVMGGCCNDIFNTGHYGAGIDAMSIEMDPTIVDWFVADLPLCTYCCPWLWNFHIRADASLVPGQRYFIGQAMAIVVCTEFEPPCFPPHDITLHYYEQQGEECPDGESYLLMACPPTAAQQASWGRVRGLYR